jgi:hypothetical protein
VYEDSGFYRDSRYSERFYERRDREILARVYEDSGELPTPDHFIREK